MFDKDRVMVVPGLRQYELNQAIRNVCRSADRDGFMMAWQNTNEGNPIGFCHLSIIGRTYVVVYGSARSRTRPMQCTAAPYQGVSAMEDGYTAFITEHLKTSAKAIGMSFPALANGLAGEHSLWRFKSFIDGKFNDRWADNSIAWRSLWGRLVEAAPRIDVAGLTDISNAVRTQLLRFAAEGQIVLDR